MRYSDIEMQGCILSNNSAHQGGGIELQTNSVATINSSTFTRNSAEHGAVISARWNASAWINNCTMEANVATTYVIAAGDWSTVHIRESELNDNECKGGDVLLGENQTLITFETSRITSNKGKSIIDIRKGKLVQQWQHHSAQ